MLYKQNFRTIEAAEKDYERLQSLLAEMKMVIIESHKFTTHGGAGKSSTLFGCPGAVELRLANWNRKDWTVDFDIKPQIVPISEK